MRSELNLVNQKPKHLAPTSNISNPRNQVHISLVSVQSSRQNANPRLVRIILCVWVGRDWTCYITILFVSQRYIGYTSCTKDWPSLCKVSIPRIFCMGPYKKFFQVGTKLVWMSEVIKWVIHLIDKLVITPKPKWFSI